MDADGRGLTQIAARILLLLRVIPCKSAAQSREMASFFQERPGKSLIPNAHTMKRHMMRFLVAINLVGCRLTDMIPALFLSSLLVGGCEGAAEPENLAELRRIAGSRGLAEAEQYLADLPDHSKLDTALAASHDTDSDISAIGINILVQSGHEDEAVPALSARVAGGDDLTRFGYAWTHADDPLLPVRMYLKICRYQLARLDSFDVTQRARVERFLSNGGLGEPLKEFSREAVENRLQRIESGFR